MGKVEQKYLILLADCQQIDFNLIDLTILQKNGLVYPLYKL